MNWKKVFRVEFLVTLKLVLGISVVLKSNSKNLSCSSKCANFNNLNFSQINSVDPQSITLDFTSKVSLGRKPSICMQCYETFNAAKLSQEFIKKLNLVTVTYKNGLNSEIKLYKHDEKGYLGIFSNKTYLIKENLSSPLKISFCELESSKDEGFTLSSNFKEHKVLPDSNGFIHVFFISLGNEFLVYDIVDEGFTIIQPKYTSKLVSMLMNFLFFSVVLSLVTFCSLKVFRLVKFSKFEKIKPLFKSKLQKEEDLKSKDEILREKQQDYTLKPISNQSKDEDLNLKDGIIGEKQQGFTIKPTSNQSKDKDHRCDINDDIKTKVIQDLNSGSDQLPKISVISDNMSQLLDDLSLISDSTAVCQNDENSLLNTSDTKPIEFLDNVDKAIDLSNQETVKSE